MARRLAIAGWRVLARQLRVGRDEVDILAVDPGPPPVVVVVEVRSRRSPRFGPPEERLDERETIVRLELKANDAGSQAVADEVRDAKAAMQSDMMKQCVGRRITDGAMKCVREAKTAAHMENECFR